MAKKPPWVLIDSNIALDVFLPSRGLPASELQSSNDIWRANDERRIVAHLTASSLTDIFYISERHTNVTLARQAVRTCLKSLRICTVDYSALKYADDLPGPDFEDNLQIACALRYNIGIIATRDKAFYKGLVPVLSPAALLKRI